MDLLNERHLVLQSQDEEFCIIRTDAPNDILERAIFDKLESLLNYKPESVTGEIRKYGYSAEVIDYEDFSIDKMIVRYEKLDSKQLV